MKKHFLLICTIALIGASCKKDYTCSCTTVEAVSDATITDNSSGFTMNYDGTSESYTLEDKTFKDKKKESESRCKSYESTITDPGQYDDMEAQGYTVTGGDKTITTTCKLK